MKKQENDPNEHNSALKVMKGLSGGHDGMPGQHNDTPESTKTSKHGARLSTEEFMRGVLACDRTILGRAITLVESNAIAHQQQAQDLLQALMPKTGKAIRVGISGVPGAGKSTLIEALGTFLTARGHKVAVMAVDPSSSLTKGSILGDKTRMEQLSREPNAFIRPSSTGGALGGVARKTREAMRLFEAAGYNIILIETVGVGQSEITVRSMVDIFLLTLIAGGGDELQGIKKGVVEIADAILINKADGDNTLAARRAKAEYEMALHYFMRAEGGWNPEVLTVSALAETGIEDIWNLISRFQSATQESGLWHERRRHQSLEWLHSMIDERLREMFYRSPEIKALLPVLEQRVMDGALPVTQAAWEALAKWGK